MKCHWIPSVLLGLAMHAAASASEPPATRPAESADRLQLGVTAITGNRELPKVMSIVPWKAAEPPSGPDRPMGSLVEAVLAPLDRDVFRREVVYFHDLAADAKPDAGKQP